MLARLPAARLLLLAALALLLPACATLGSSERGDDEERRPDPRTEEPRAEEPPDAREEAPRTVRGFRIQILSTEEKAVADQRAAEAEDAWSDPVVVAWRAPYYRVRVGAFPSRAAAERRLAAVQEQYPDAFLVPDTVTIYPE